MKENIYGYKRKGKEYRNNILEFEGDYIFNDKWSGKGYDKNGNVVYELINGNGKIIEFNEEGEIIFEGEYANSKKNGKGKEYNLVTHSYFEGEYANGKKNGIGKEFTSYGMLMFEAEYLNGEMIRKIKKYHDYY